MSSQGGWSCPYFQEERCVRRNKNECKPGDLGCILEGKTEITGQSSQENRIAKKREAPKNAFSKKS